MNEEMNTEMNQETGAGEAGESRKAEQGKGKLFTQEEVNGFIQSRLAQMKKQAAKESAGEYEQKMKDLESREMKLLTREKLMDKGMPQELADIISCTDEKDIEEKLDRLNRIYGSSKKEEKQEETRGFQIGAGISTGQPDAVREAFGLNR